MFQIKVVEQIKTYVLCSITFFPTVVPLMIYCTAGHATDDTVAHAHSHAGSVRLQIHTQNM